VRLLDAAGRELARGLSRCTATEAAAVAGKARAELPPALADHGVIVHADELVVGGHTF
jgi:glutamate 5-kinase